MSAAGLGSFISVMVGLWVGGMTGAGISGLASGVAVVTFPSTVGLIFSIVASIAG